MNSDQDLLFRYRVKNEQIALGALFRKYMEDVFKICFHYIKCDQTAEDQTMEVYRKVLEACKKYEIENFKAWLITITHNHCKTYLSNRQKKQIAHQKFQNSNNLETHTENLAFSKPNESEDVLKKSLESLKECQYECLSLHYLDGYSYKEIEQITSFSLKNIKSHIQNGKKNLKKILSKKKFV